MHLLLEYALAEDYLERRAALREDHLALVRAAHERGEVVLAGALPDPSDRALLVWTAPREVVERFAANDPYVVQGLVTGWTVREWNVVVGGQPRPSAVGTARTAPADVTSRTPSA